MVTAKHSTSTPASLRGGSSSTFFPYTARGVTGMLLRVDFDSKRVVGFQPQPFTEVEQPPIATRELTDEDKARARQIFNDDARIQQLLSSRDYVEALTTHWFLKERSLGAGVIVDLREPQAIEFDWPYIDIADSGDSYTQFTVNFNAPQVDRLDVLIDLERGEVAAIIPSGA